MKRMHLKHIPKASFVSELSQSMRVAFIGAGTPYALVFAFVAYHYQGHDMTSCCWLVVMGSERFASPIMGIFCGGLNAYCMRIWPLFLRISGSSGVLKAFLLERNRQLSCNPKKKKKKKKRKLYLPWIVSKVFPSLQSRHDHTVKSLV